MNTLTSTVSVSSTSAISPLDLTDEHLMELVQQQDQQALAWLYDRYAGVVKSVVMKTVHNEAESDDLLQEIFMEVWNPPASFDPHKGRPLGWLITLSRRRAIDRLRKREAYQRAEERLKVEVEQQPDAWTVHAEDELIHGDVREMLQRVLATLPPAQKQAIELAFYKGMSQREIATHTGIPLGTIKTRLELGLKKISVALEEFAGEL